MYNQVGCDRGEEMAYRAGNLPLDNLPMCIGCQHALHGQGCDDCPDNPDLPRNLELELRILKMARAAVDLDDLHARWRAGLITLEHYRDKSQPLVDALCGDNGEKLLTAYDREIAEVMEGGGQ